MKYLSRFFLASFFVCLILSACKKTTVQPGIDKPADNVTIKNGIVSFSTIAAYEKVAENQHNEQDAVNDKLENESFKSLSKNSVRTESTQQANRVYLTTFNPELYTTYMLSVLNTNKIFRMDGFLIKVDMDNAFCSFIDETIYPNDAADLAANNFANTHIHTFLNEDEPAVEVLKQLRAGTITWDGYQTQLARKVNNPGGICVKSGAKGALESKTDPYVQVQAGGSISAKARYVKNFLHFALEGSCFIFNPNPPYTIPCTSSVRMNCTFQWVGACKGSSSGSSWTDNTGATCSKLLNVLYSAGSPLVTRKLRVDVYVKKGAYSTILSQYSWAFANGSLSPKIGY